MAFTGLIVKFVLWLSCSLLAATDYLEYYHDLSDTQKIAFIAVFLIGGPFFVIANGLGNIIEYIIPEDDDHIKPFNGH